MRTPPQIPLKSHPFRRIALLLAATVALLTSGCAAGPSMQGPAAIAAGDYRRTFEAGVETLREQGFEISRQDYRFGRITTRPRPAPTAFEFWRNDNSTAEQALAATFNAEERVVTVKIDSAESGAAVAGQYQVAVEVAILREQRVGRRLTGSADGHHIVRPLADVPDNPGKEAAPPPYRTLANRDEPMEQRLLALVMQRAGQMATDPSAAPQAP